MISTVFSPLFFFRTHHFYTCCGCLDIFLFVDIYIFTVSKHILRKSSIKPRHVLYVSLPYFLEMLLFTQKFTWYPSFSDPDAFPVPGSFSSTLLLLQVHTHTLDLTIFVSELLSPSLSTTGVLFIGETSGPFFGFSFFRSLIAFFQLYFLSEPGSTGW